jgi:phospholipid N-methyltransferase
MMTSFVKFFLAALKSPLQLSTLFETGPRVAARFAERVHLRNDQVLVELGVGAGAVTSALMKRVGGPKQYLGFELNEDLFKYLKQAHPEWEIHNDSAENLLAHLNHRHAGAVVSTLPWSLLPKDRRDRILQQVHAALDSGGVFATYVTLHVSWSAAARDFLKEMEKLFGPIETEREMLNLPPCRLYFARKK